MDRHLPPVSVSPRTGEVIVWPNALPNGQFARRKPDGSWVFGHTPTKEELQDDFEPCWSLKACEGILKEARAALYSRPD